MNALNVSQACHRCRRFIGQPTLKTICCPMLPSNHYWLDPGLKSRASRAISGVLLYLLWVPRLYRRCSSASHRCHLQQILNNSTPWKRQPCSFQLIQLSQPPAAAHIATLCRTQFCMWPIHFNIRTTLLSSNDSLPRRKRNKPSLANQFPTILCRI